MKIKNPDKIVYQWKRIMGAIGLILLSISFASFLAPHFLNWGIEQSIPEFTTGYNVSYSQYIMTGYLEYISDTEAWLVVGSSSYLIDLKNQSGSTGYKICKHEPYDYDNPIRYLVSVTGDFLNYKYTLRRELC